MAWYPRGFRPCGRSLVLGFLLEDITLVPHEGSLWSYHGEVLRYRVEGPFDSPSSWEAYDHGSDCEPAVTCAHPDGYRGGVFDGRFIYFVPYSTTDAVIHGEVLRYDTLPDNQVPAVSEWGLVVMTLLVLSTGTIMFRRRWAE